MSDTSLKESRASGESPNRLGGSQARGTADRHSDVDLGLYYDSLHPLRSPDLRRAACELDDRHIPGLVPILANGVRASMLAAADGRRADLDFIYHDLKAVAGAIEECRRGEPKSIYQLGHPLGFHNRIYAGEVACCRPLFDPRGAVEELKKLVQRYPAALRRAAVRKHLFNAAFKKSLELRTSRQRVETYYIQRVACFRCKFRANSPRGMRPSTTTADSARTVPAS